MNTKEWNFIDKFISKYRLLVVSKYIECDDIVLDLGCGVQHYLLTSGRAKFKLGFGLDYDVQDSQEGNIRLINYKFQGNLPLKEDFFSKVFMLAVLEHFEVEDVPGLFSEFYRILKKGGRVIITTPTPRAKPVLEFLAFKLKIVTPEEVTDHKHYYINEEICNLAAVCGLKVIEAKPFQLGWNSLYVLEKI